MLLAVEEISQKCVIHRSPSRVTCTMQQELHSLVLLVQKRLRTMNYYFETTHDKDNGFKKIVQDRHHDSLKLQKGKLCIGSGHDNIIIRKLATVLPITSLQLISIHWYGHQTIVTCK